MIDAKELRIGNMVMFMGREIFVHGGTIQDLERDNAVQSQYEPIPLTTEILEKCGFELKNHKWYDGSISDNYYWNGWYNIGWNEYYQKRTYFLGRRTNENNSEWLANIDYLHQLQNLYYALTQKELEINP